MRIRSLSLMTFAFGVGGWLAGCGSSSSSSPSSTSAQGQGGAGGAGAGGSGPGGAAGSGPSAAPCQKDGDLDLNGVWLLKVSLDVVLKSDADALIQVCPAGQEGASELLLVMQITQSGAQLGAVSGTVCSFSLPQVKAQAGKCQDNQTGAVTAEVTPSPALAAALPTFTTPPVMGTLGGTANGSTFLPDGFDFVLGSKAGGAQMARWVTSSSCDDPTMPLGTTMTCEAMCVSDCADAVDQDMDGYPGVSVDVCGYDMGEAQGASCHAEDPATAGVLLQGHAALNFQVNPKLSGTADNSCQISGSVVAQIVYDVLGADVRLGGAPLPVRAVIKAIPAFDVVPEKSKFRALRVDGKYGAPDLHLAVGDGQAACQAAQANQNSIF